ncbi:MAG: alcohol dehydrogenase catalytic domain-containing protein [Bacilli bacterium]
MKAIVWHNKRDIRYEEVQDACNPGVGELRVHVAFCGICGTDLEEFLEGPIFIPVHPHPLTGACAPLILGHEFSGVVDAVGADVDDFQVGDHVAADALLYCGTCECCNNHLYNLCPYMGALGLMADGGLAEFVTARATTFVKVPLNLPLDITAMAEPLAVAVRSLRRADLRTGQKLLIMGGGTIGLLVLQAARLYGAGHITLVEPAEYRAHLAKSLGADQVVSPSSMATKPEFHRAIDCTGKPAAQVAALQCLRPQGRLVLVGIPTAATEINTLDIVNFEREVVGSLSHIVDEDFTTAIRLLDEGLVNVRALISATLPLSQGVDAFQLLGSGHSDILKILISPDDPND